IDEYPMIFLSAQPDQTYFIWQLEIQLRNFHNLGVPKEQIQVLASYQDEVGLNPNFQKFMDGSSHLANFYIYTDLRKNPKYTSSIRPNILKQHFEKHPHLEKETLFYHDSDILFSRIPQIPEVAMITWAIAHDEDLIYCICDQHASIQFNWDILTSVIHDLVPEKVSMLFIDAKYESSIVVNQHCVAIDGVEAVSSFILVRPIYNFVLSILENREEITGMGWLNFLQFISPHSFLFSPDNTELNCGLKFHIISTFRNAAAYLKDYMVCLQKQRYRNFHAYLIDDCSDDGSSELIEESENITMIVNSERKYALPNIVHVLRDQNIADNDVVCILDADDRFPHKYVLNVLRAVYTDENVLSTHGSSQYFDGYR